MLTVKTEDTDDPEVCHYHRDCCAHWALCCCVYTSIKVRVRQLQPHSEALCGERGKPPLTL